MSNDKIDLQHERLRTDELSKSFHDARIPVAVAAALTFHQASGSTKAIATREDYEDALNISAAALCRLVPVYRVEDPRDGPVPVRIDLASQYFARGAPAARYAALLI